MRNLTFLLVLVLVLTLGLVNGCNKASEQGPVYKIGYMNCNSEQETQQRFAALTRYLSEKVGVRFEMVPVDTQDFDERFAKGEFAFTHTNSLLYLIMHQDHGLELVATEKRGQFGPRTAGTIISRKGSGIRTMADLKGKRMIFGPQLAPSGYLAQYDLMLKNGLDPEMDLAYYAIPHGSFKHEKLVYAVYFGAYDVAAAPALDLELMIHQGKISADDFQIVAQTPIFPYCTFGAAKGLDPDLVKRFRQALVGLTASDTIDYNGETVYVLKSAWVDGFEQLLDSDYDILRGMAKRANMPPYQEF